MRCWVQTYEWEQPRVLGRHSFGLILVILVIQWLLARFPFRILWNMTTELCRRDCTTGHVQARTQMTPRISTRLPTSTDQHMTRTSPNPECPYSCRVFNESCSKRSRASSGWGDTSRDVPCTSIIYTSKQKTPVFMFSSSSRLQRCCVTLLKCINRIIRIDGISVIPCIASVHDIRSVHVQTSCLLTRQDANPLAWRIHRMSQSTGYL